jgi:hypothetical protein
MAKKPPNQAQLEFIRNNCHTHDEHALAEATGLDPETIIPLRAEALAATDKGFFRNTSQVHPGVHVMQKSMVQRLDDAARPDPKRDDSIREEQRRKFDEHVATYIAKSLPS